MPRDEARSPEIGLINPAGPKADHDIKAAPAMRPFSSTICNGSASEIFRVKLLSIAQATQAQIIASGPTTFCRVGSPDQARITAPATIQTIPSAIRRSKFSWNINQAIRAVAAPSNVKSNDAVAASVWSSPNISRRGPAIPPAVIAPASHGISLRLNVNLRSVRSRTVIRAMRRISATPIPAPQ